jgi:tetratricopeptide (TPR) repeat protein
VPVQPPGTAAPLPDVGHDRLLTVFPHDLGHYLDPGPPEPEHRLAGIGFIRVSGTDARLAADGPDWVADAMHAVVSRLEECLAAESVTLLSTDLGSDGAGFFVASGVPHASEDDDGRLLRALKAFVDSDLPLSVQAGCNRGHVFVAEVGASTRAAFSAMGDTTNTAARIMSKAEPGLLYAHPVVLEHSRTLFDTEPAGPFAMKGKALPLLVYDVGDESGTREADEVGRLPLLGRDDELAELRAALERAVRGQGGVITVTGTTGMGKTRLVREAAVALEGVARLTVRAEPYGAASSYRVFRDPLRLLLGIERGTAGDMGRQLLASLESAAPELLPMAPLIADVAHVDVPSTPEAVVLDPQYRPDRLADVLIAEEAHWADAASAHLLDRIAAATRGRPWAVVAVRRGTEGGFTPSQGTTIALGPLPDPIIERLVIAATEAAPLRPHEVQGIVDRAEGNPLFVEEITRVARTVGTQGSMPDSLHAAMAAQIDVLEPTERRILRTAAVLGRSFRREILRETLSADGLTRDPGRLTQLSDFLEAEGRDRLRFRNSLLRDAAYEELAYRTRARLHRAAGLATERLSTDLESDAPTLSLHFSRAGDDERTWTYGRMAGEAARRAYANSDAAAQYELALSAAKGLAIPMDELVRAWMVLGELRELAGLLAESTEAYRRAAVLVEDPAHRAEIMARLARVQDRAGRHTAALRTVTRARHLIAGDAGVGARRAAVRLDNLTAIIRLGQERAAQGRAFAVRAADGAREVDDPETLLQALMGIDHADLILGRPIDGRHTREALEICVAHGFRPQESVARANLGGYAFLAGRWDEAAEWYRSSRTVALEAGNAFGAAETEINLGDILLSRGELDEAESIVRDAVRVLRASGMEWETAYGEMLLARASLARGEVHDALRRIEPAIATFTGLGTRMTALEASLVRAEALSRRGDYEAALNVVDAAQAAAKDEVGPLVSRCHLQRALAMRGLGARGDADVELELGLSAARADGMSYEEALILIERARVREAGAQQDGAAADRAVADSILTRLGARA